MLATTLELATANRGRHLGPARNKSLFALALIISSLVVIQPIMGTSTQSTLNVSWLHTSGTHIYNEIGGIVDLHGVNFVSGEGEGINLVDIQNAKQLGFNAFRYMDYWGLIQPYNETLNGIDVTHFTTGKIPLYVGLDQLVNWAIQENMYFIICVRWTESWPPPKWAFRDLSDDTQRYAALINGDAVKERTGFLNTWKYIANRYKNVPNVLFELLNESNVLDTSLAGNAYENFNEQVISAIESVETIPHLKIVELLLESSAWSEIIDGASDVNRSNVLWATHHYTPMNNYDLNGRYWHESFTWHGQYFPAGWGNVTTMVAWRTIRDAEKIRSWNKPWIATEFSKVVTQSNWQVWYDTTLQTMTDYDISGWMFYCYSSDTTKEVGWNLRDSSTEQEIMPVLDQYIEMAPQDNQTSTTQATSSTTSTPTTTSGSTTSSTTTPTISTTTQTTSSSSSVTSTTTSASFSSLTQTSSMESTMTITSPSTSSAQMTSLTTPTATVITTSSTIPSSTSSTPSTTAVMITSSSTTATGAVSSSASSTPTMVTTTPSLTTSLTTITTSSSTTINPTLRISTTSLAPTTSMTLSATQTSQVTTIASSSTMGQITVFVTVAAAPQIVTQTVTQSPVTVTVTAGSGTTRSTMTTARAITSTTTRPSECHGKFCSHGIVPTQDTLSFGVLLLLLSFVGTQGIFIRRRTSIVEE